NNVAFVLRAQGDNAGARPLYERALAISKEMLGERHPDIATGLNNLAGVLWAEGAHPAAARSLQQAVEIARGNLDLAAAAQSEGQQLAMARQLRGSLDAYLSIAPLARLSAGDLYHHVLASKGAVFERQRRFRAQQRPLQADPQSSAAGRFAMHEQTVRQ